MGEQVMQCKLNDWFTVFDDADESTSFAVDMRCWKPTAPCCIEAMMSPLPASVMWGWLEPLKHLA